MIAHRMSSAMRAGQVLVLDGSARAVTGTHETLRRTSVVHAELAGSWVDPGTAAVQTVRELSKDKKVHHDVNPGTLKRN
jgi:ATP-binding cassette subfamily C protein